MTLQIENTYPAGVNADGYMADTSSVATPFSGSNTAAAFIATMPRYARITNRLEIVNGRKMAPSPSGDSARRHAVEQVRHLDRGHGSFGALVAGFPTRTVERLLERVGGEHAEDDRHAAVGRRARDTRRDHAAHHVVVAGRAAHHGTEGHHGVDATTLGHALRDQRDLDRAGHPGDGDVVVIDAHASEGVERSVEQATGDELVETTDHQPDPQAGGRQMPLEDVHDVTIAVARRTRPQAGPQAPEGAVAGDGPISLPPRFRAG